MVPTIDNANVYKATFHTWLMSLSVLYTITQLLVIIFFKELSFNFICNLKVVLLSIFYL